MELLVSLVVLFGELAEVEGVGCLGNKVSVIWNQCTKAHLYLITATIPKERNRSSTVPLDRCERHNRPSQIATSIVVG